jgi:hypothetical protein
MTTPATPPPPAPVPPTIHELKTWPKFFEAVRDGLKNFEIRNNDRDFKVGDVLLLQEYDFDRDQYSGYDVSRRVTYITDFAQAADFIVMGLEPIEDATRAPLPAEPSSSESSGDVHLRQARERIAELEKQLATETQIHKGELKESANILAGLEQDLAAAHTSLELYTGTTLRLESELREERTLSGQLMIERDEAKAISQKHGERTKELARQLEQRGIDLDAALARAETAERERDEMKARWQGAENSNAMAIGALEALATSPAPIAVGEKDSAGPTPRTDAFIRECDGRLGFAFAQLHNHANKLERELTASESLRREELSDHKAQLWAVVDVLESEKENPAFVRRAKGLRRYLEALTPPVAGEGGEGK